MKIGIVGSRGFNNYKSFKETVKKILKPEDIIVSGGCLSGADHLAEIYAKEENHQIEIYKPDWDTYGKMAGMIRNTTIIDNSDYVVAFWDGFSRGTKDTITKTQNVGKYCITIDIRKET